MNRDPEDRCFLIHIYVVAAYGRGDGVLWRVILRKLIDEVLGYVRKVSGVKVPPYPKIGDLISLISPQRRGWLAGRSFHES